MKRLIILTLFIITAFSPRALAATAFDGVLSERISEKGVWNGAEGIIYAGKIKLEGDSLLIVSAADSVINCEIYDNTDGMQLTDTLSLSCRGAAVCRLLTVRNSEKNYIMFSRGSENEYYTVENDAFITETPDDCYPVTSIAASENGKIISSLPEGSVYNALNRLKQERINAYTMTNRISSLSEEEREKIKRTLSACADIMRFDIKKYDYDTLFKYVLYTHQNFKILTDIDPKTAQSSALGYNSVYLVNAEFIDHIMKNVFRITPEKPSVNSLMSRGFCYNDGYYLYTGGFDVYFATDIRDIIAAYDLGGNAVFLVFSDIYYEGGSQIPEYSFAVLQKSGGQYSILRLGMGESMPSEGELRAYSPFSAYGKISWRGDGTSENAIRDRSNLIFIVFFIVMSVGAVGLICSIIILLKLRK